MANDDDDMSAVADMSAAHAADRAMPSFCVRDWSMVRLALSLRQTLAGELDRPPVERAPLAS